MKGQSMWIRYSTYHFITWWKRLVHLPFCNYANQNYASHGDNE